MWECGRSVQPVQQMTIGQFNNCERWQIIEELTIWNFNLRHSPKIHTKTMVDSSFLLENLPLSCPIKPSGSISKVRHVRDCFTVNILWIILIQKIRINTYFIGVEDSKGVQNEQGFSKSSNKNFIQLGIIMSYNNRTIYV